MEEFIYYKNKKVLPCFLEIVHSRVFNNVMKKFEKSMKAVLYIKPVVKGKFQQVC